MCNLYSITTNQAAIIALFRVITTTSATCRRCRAEIVCRSQNNRQAMR